MAKHCPFMLFGRHNRDPDLHFARCLENACEWWVVKDEACAVKLIAKLPGINKTRQSAMTRVS